MKGDHESRKNRRQRRAPELHENHRIHHQHTVPESALAPTRRSVTHATEQMAMDTRYEPTISAESFVGRTPVANTINATNSINPNIITVNTGNKPISGLTSSGTVNSHRNSNSNNSITNSNANLPKQNGGMTLNRQNTRVEYAPDYRRVTNRWIRNADGSVTDLQPQWPWDSIYFHIFSPTFLATERKRTLVIRLHFLHGLVNRQRLPFLHLRKNLKDLNLRADNGQSL